MKTKITALILGILLTGVAEAKTIRATEMNSSLWSRLTAGTAEELIVEFRQGDELPVSFTAEGDLLETTRTGTSYVSVKRNFWLKLQNDNIQMSLDGAAYKSIKDVISGSLTAGAGSEQNGGVANAINLGLKANLK